MVDHIVPLYPLWVRTLVREGKEALIGASIQYQGHMLTLCPNPSGRTHISEFCQKPAFDFLVLLADWRVLVPLTLNREVPEEVAR